jgi:hypothetical protein
MLNFGDGAELALGLVWFVGLVNDFILFFALRNRGDW